MAEYFLEEDQNRVYENLNIDKDKLEHYMYLFSQWIASQKYLPQNFNEGCREKFLVWAKLDFEKAKKKFQRFCYNSITHSEFYSDRLLTLEGDIKKSLEFVYVISMPKLTPNGCRVTVAKIFGDENFHLLVMIRSMILYMDFRIHKDITVSGEMWIFDMQGLKPHHYAKLFNPTYLKFIKLVFINYPFLVKNLFIVNCHPFLEKGIGLIKSVMPQKIADRVIILSDPKDSGKHIPAECLPEDYGGSELSLASLRSSWEEFWLDQKQLYEELDRCKPSGSVPEEFEVYQGEYGADEFSGERKYPDRFLFHCPSRNKRFISLFLDNARRTEVHSTALYYDSEKLEHYLCVYSNNLFPIRSNCSRDFIQHLYACRREYRCRFAKGKLKPAYDKLIFYNMAEKVIEVLSKEEEVKILQEVRNIDPEKLEHYMKLFVEWIATQRNLPQDFGENCIKKFLIWSKLDLEKAKKRFQNFCYNTVTREDFFSNRIISRDGDLRILDSVCVVQLPKLTPKGLRVNIFTGINPENFDTFAFARYSSLVCDFLIRVANAVAGEIIIYDFGCFKPQDYAKLFDAICFKLVKFNLTHYPFIMAHIFIVNCHPLLQKGINICKAIIPKKVADRVEILKDPEELKKYIPEDSLPSNYGGKGKSLKELQVPIVEYFLDNKEYYVKIGEVKPSGPIPEEYKSSSDNEFGVEGSFRMLNID
ncbi:hypothetical protein Trydic_g23271 [Trypoxylus dichotomus]